MVRWQLRNTMHKSLKGFQAQRLLENLNVKVDSTTDISMLTLAIDKNEEALKDIREAADALLYFIGRERATLQNIQRGELFKN